VLISDELFEAYLKCKTKAQLTLGQAWEGDPSHSVSQWQRHLAENYQAACRDRLRSAAGGDFFDGTPSSEDLRSAKYRVIIQPRLTAQDVGTNMHALQRGTALTEKRHSPYAPVRFISFENVSKNHKLMLAFDAFVLGTISGQMPIKGLIIHGSQHECTSIKLDALIHEVESSIKKLRSLLTDSNPPNPVLIKHCSECIFEASCRKRVTEKDDLSLLDGLGTAERTAPRAPPTAPSGRWRRRSPPPARPGSVCSHAWSQAEFPGSSCGRSARSSRAGSRAAVPTGARPPVLESLAAENAVPTARAANPRLLAQRSSSSCCCGVNWICAAPGMCLETHALTGLLHLSKLNCHTLKRKSREISAGHSIFSTGHLTRKRLYSPGSAWCRTSDPGH
jgi:hypothetical protein